MTHLEPGKAFLQVGWLVEHEEELCSAVGVGAVPAAGGPVFTSVFSYEVEGAPPWAWGLQFQATAGAVITCPRALLRALTSSTWDHEPVRPRASLPGLLS